MVEIYIFYRRNFLFPLVFKLSKNWRQNYRVCVRVNKVSFVVLLSSETAAVTLTTSFYVLS